MSHSEETAFFANCFTTRNIWGMFDNRVEFDAVSK